MHGEEEAYKINFMEKGLGSYKQSEYPVRKAFSAWLSGWRVGHALGKQFTYIKFFSVHPSAKWVPGNRRLKCIDFCNLNLTRSDITLP